MTSKISVEAKKCEFMVSNAMDDATRASKKILMDYLCKMYYVPLAKTIAYLELDDRAIQKILRELDQQTLAKALKGTDPEVQNKIFRNMSMRASSMLKEDMEFMGPARAEDVYAARAEVLKIIFRLEEGGHIVIYSNPVSELID